MTELSNPIKTFPGTSEVITCTSYEISDRYLVKLTVAAPYKNSQIQRLIESANIRGVSFGMSACELLSYSTYVSFVYFKADLNGFVDVMKFLTDSTLITHRDFNNIIRDLGVLLNLYETDSDTDIDFDTDSEEIDIPSHRPGM
jgi:hypothetical protein